ncbi:NAD(+) kinase [Pseudohongiella spirulinae]|uniref:NAD kinase n=1 Tax=Pseudohongiella spirulinae TaxID=1249552 RepID=A0A0S2KEK1_9GAMM|nr:NAD(+) kinase [Pseudohongiella spirulinae]ALO46542.1 inorganic polyphosphate/ATP-NAD kinase [Pseudohongiella spirulinae]
MSTFKKLGLVGRPGHAGVVSTLRRLIEYLQTRHLEIVLEQSTAELLPDISLPVHRRHELGGECDLVVVVGGDGSMLNAARALVNHDVPVLGINRGRLGFLTDILPEELETSLDAVLAGRYREEKRFMLDFTVRRDDELLPGGTALNDVVLHPGTAAQMIEFELFIDNQFVNSQQSDGLIVATPTGSTAYSLSAGGPIMHPSLNALVLVPMYPHTLSSRPLVVDADLEIRIAVVKQRAISPLVSCDGAVRFHTEPGDEIIIRKKAGPLRLIHPLEYNYYEVCRSKLGWGNRLVRDDA